MRPVLVSAQMKDNMYQALQEYNASHPQHQVTDEQFQALTNTHGKPGVSQYLAGISDHALASMAKTSVIT